MDRKDHEKTREKALRAQNAARELDLSSITKADKARVLRVQAGLHALDDLQTYFKNTIYDVLEDNPEDTGPVASFLRDLQKNWDLDEFVPKRRKKNGETERMEQPNENIVEALRLVVKRLEKDQMKPTVPQILPFVQALYEVEIVGGSLHIMLDDGNTEDNHVDYCIESAKKRGDVYGELLARALKFMSETQRLKLFSHPEKRNGITY